MGHTKNTHSTRKHKAQGTYTCLWPESRSRGTTAPRSAVQGEESGEGRLTHAQHTRPASPQRRRTMVDVDNVKQNAAKYDQNVAARPRAMNATPAKHSSGRKSLSQWFIVGQCVWFWSIDFYKAANSEKWRIGLEDSHLANWAQSAAMMEAILWMGEPWVLMGRNCLGSANGSAQHVSTMFP